MHRERAEPRPVSPSATSAEFPADARSAGRGRAFVGQFCAAHGLTGDVRRTASLLVSELVTNAIVHGRSGTRIDIGLRARVLRVSVYDDSAASLPPVDRQPRGAAEGGRGLLIVSMLAARWGSEATEGGGKAVWFELDT